MAKVCRPLFPCSLVYLLIRPGLSGGPAPAIAASQEADTLGVTFSTAWRPLHLSVTVQEQMEYIVCLSSSIFMKSWWQIMDNHQRLMG